MNIREEKMRLWIKNPPEMKFLTPTNLVKNLFVIMKR